MTTCDAVGTDRYPSSAFWSLNWKYYTFFGTKENLEELSRRQKALIFKSYQWYRHLKLTKETFLSNVVKSRCIKINSLGRNLGSLGSITGLTNSAHLSYPGEVPWIIHSIWLALLNLILVLKFLCASIKMDALSYYFCYCVYLHLY